MIVYYATKEQFLVDASSGIEDIVRNKVQQFLGINISQSSGEYNSWKNSLGNAMYHAMNSDLIPNDAIVAVEYSIPGTTKRIDFLVSGLDEQKQENIVIIELKQWTDAVLTDKDGVVKTHFKGRLTNTTHPSYQAWSYSSLLYNFNETVYSENITLQPCAYLHNLEDQDCISNVFYDNYLKKAPVFYKGQKDNLQKYISKLIKYGDSNNALRRIDDGKARPSKELADNLASMMRGNQEFILIDDQKLVYEDALSLARNISQDKKSVLIIQGGPGTGKSVVAINLLVQTIGMGLNSHYVTKNAAPRAVFEAKLTGSMKKTEISALFQNSGAYMDATREEIDVLIVDEAHRLNEKSGHYGNLGENQIKELINAAQLTIFFIDEDQKVTWRDIGEVGEIEKWANHFNADIYYGELASQFRCNGSDGYLSWVDNSLQIRETANRTLDGIIYDFKVFDSPEIMREAIIAKNSNNKARMLAGYCWDWVSKKNKNNNDIEFPDHGFSMQWNLAEDGGAYSIAPNSIDQVGCIHTIQGLDLEYSGVIIGPDLVVRDGKVITNPDKRAKTDRSLWGYKKDLKNNVAGTEEKVDAIIKNTYRTLMTRAMKGTYVYCTDEETRDYFKNLISQPI